MIARFLLTNAVGAIFFVASIFKPVGNPVLLFVLAVVATIYALVVLLAGIMYTAYRSSNK